MHLLHFMALLSIADIFHSRPHSHIVARKNKLPKTFEIICLENMTN